MKAMPYGGFGMSKDAVKLIKAICAYKSRIWSIKKQHRKEVYAIASAIIGQSL